MENIQPSFPHITKQSLQLLITPNMASSGITNMCRSVLLVVYNIKQLAHIQASSSQIWGYRIICIVVCNMILACVICYHDCLL